MNKNKERKTDKGEKTSSNKQKQERNNIHTYIQTNKQTNRQTKDKTNTRKKIQQTQK